jgi:hypothetical protein
MIISSTKIAKLVIKESNILTKLNSMNNEKIIDAAKKFATFEKRELSSEAAEAIAGNASHC